MKKIFFLLLCICIYIQIQAQTPGSYAGRALEQRFIGYNLYGYPIYQSIWVDMVWVQEWTYRSSPYGGGYWVSFMKRIPRSQIDNAPMLLKNDVGNTNFIFSNNQYMNGYYQYYQPTYQLQNSGVKTFMVGTIVGTMVTAIILK